MGEEQSVVGSQESGVNTPAEKVCLKYRAVTGISSAARNPVFPFFTLPKHCHSAASSELVSLRSKEPCIYSRCSLLAVRCWEQLLHSLLRSELVSLRSKEPCIYNRCTLLAVRWWEQLLHSAASSELVSLRSKEPCIYSRCSLLAVRWWEQLLHRKLSQTHE